MAMISGARSGLSISAYSIPFSSQTMHTAHVYVDRAEPMISGFGMAVSALSSRDLHYSIEAASACGVNQFPEEFRNRRRSVTGHSRHFRRALLTSGLPP